MNKKIINAHELEEMTLKAVRSLSEIVATTLGPGGRPILIERTGQALNGQPLKPKITKDGVSVAQECGGATPEEDVIVQCVKDICQKTNRDAGDGTTTAIVLGEAILTAASELIERYEDLQPGRLASVTPPNPQQIRASLQKVGGEVLTRLDEMAWPLEDPGLIAQVAAVSANGDEEVGRVIAEAFKAVGAEGVVTVDEGSGSGITLDVVEGYQFDRGAQSRQNFFNNKDLTAFEAEGVSVVIFDGSLRSHLDIIPMLMLLADVDPKTDQPRKPFPPTILIANEFSRDVLQFMLIQKSERGLQLCPVIGPNLTHIRTGYYDDLAAYTGGKRLGNGNLSLTEVRPEHVGHVKKASVDGYHTTLYEGSGSEDEVLRRVAHLSALRSKAESPYDSQVCNDRIASLTNGVAKIGVGGATEVEILERYDRIEDALNAARAALQEGVVTGGGTALVKIAQELYNRPRPMEWGAFILARALPYPLIQILRNVGFVEDEILEIMEKIKAGGEYAVYDAFHLKFEEDGRAKGIIDPVKVTKSALKNALSVASLLLTAGGAVVYEREGN